MTSFDPGDLIRAGIEGETKIRDRGREKSERERERESNGSWESERTSEVCKRRKIADFS